jgi:gluconate 2-dehydrogenase subunit 3-like protein
MAQSFRESGHLPQRRPDGEPAPPEGLPRQRRGTTPQRHGRYPDYDVLEHAGHWDEVTRRTVLARVDDVPPLRFFDAAEAATLRAFCDTVTAQDAEPRIPVLEMVDAKLHAGRLDGFRYADMPRDDETWRRVARGLDEAAGGSFAALAEDGRRAVVGRFAAGELTGGTWAQLPCARAWSVVTRAVLSAFYSHPWAWNEIGYGGPRYPRGYVRLQADGHAFDEGVEAFDVDPVPDVARRGG